MKIKYVPPRKDMGLPIVDSHGNQLVIGMLQDDHDIVVLFVDLHTGSIHIERVVNKLAQEMLMSSNFTTIDSTEQWNEYAKFFTEHECVPDKCYL